jgi:transcriptional regulator with XRE-family HTH domain
MTKKTILKPFYQGKGSSELIDAYVGSRIKSRRIIVSMSQTELGKILGVTFQQVQKYECGKNRVSASRLYQLSQILDVGMEFFFHGYSENKPSTAYSYTVLGQEDFSWLEANDGDLMERKETLELVRTYYQVQDENVRKNFIKMFKSLVATQE